MKEQVPLQQNEEIVPIKGYEGLYSITNSGGVWSHRRIKKNDRGKREIGGYYIKPYLDKRGFIELNCLKKGCVHYIRGVD